MVEIYLYLHCRIVTLRYATEVGSYATRMRLAAMIFLHKLLIYAPLYMWRFWQTYDNSGPTELYT